ncbi:glycosyltransferase [Vibrio sp. DW001]|uniref:glycosyltransferase n=1 Tax=Vibrio sp. DW001 TaxID=2912315 RepID=UPI0023B1CD37|nr:glycosyltransferase [Vibrio sp. DW001]WED26879.1 glycosyltransferase [Vibrio sp. DW001]
MKIHILFELKEGATGGGNQFLKAIRDYFTRADIYTEIVSEADIILYNSHQFITELMEVKRKYPDKLFVHRIDGPIRLYSNMNDRRDFVINNANKLIADASIFQSNWSKKKGLSMGLVSNRFETTILNAPNPGFFNPKTPTKLEIDKKIKLIATSWSSNIKKGFEVYKWLDENLDFDIYDMTFVGNSPVTFENINYKKPMNSEDLSVELKNHDLFITASQNDPCSNSLIEALHCGLPCIGLNEGGHTEIISSGGELFDNKEDILILLEKIVSNYSVYQNNIDIPDIDVVGEKYSSFLEMIYLEKKYGNYQSKKFGIYDHIFLLASLSIWKLSEKFTSHRKN